MSLTAEIRGVLSAGPRNAEQIADLIGCTVKQAAQNLSNLKTHGKVKAAGTIGGRISYAIDAWPEKSLRGAGKDAPPKSAGKGKRGKKGSRTRAAELPAAPATTGASAEEFAITDSGVLAIKQGDLALQIQPASFARLRKFIDRADAIINPSE